MGEYETLESLLFNVDLSLIEQTVKKGYHQDGPGRPPRSPLGLFNANIVKRIMGIRSERELVRKLSTDHRLRGLCRIEDHERPYGIAVLSRFRKRVGPRRLGEIIDSLLRKLTQWRVIGGEKVAMDTSPIKAYSRRSLDNRSGSSDPDARVGRGVRGYILGYKLHLAVDACSELPVAFTVAPANRNEKVKAPLLLGRAQRLLGKRLEVLVADSQYSSQRFRNIVSANGVEAVIPYPSNQRRGKRGLLRVDKRFHVHGPPRLKRLYGLRSAVERVFSRLDLQLSLSIHKLRGLRNISTHAAYCIIALFLIAEASWRLGDLSHIRSVTYFAT